MPDCGNSEHTSKLGTSPRSLVAAGGCAVYNDIGTEVVISHQAYYEQDGAVTDMVVMGTVYQGSQAHPEREPQNPALDRCNLASCRKRTGKPGMITL